jgi:hypothetical protein
MAVLNTPSGLKPGLEIYVRGIYIEAFGLLPWLFNCDPKKEISPNVFIVSL